MLIGIQTDLLLQVEELYASEYKNHIADVLGTMDYLAPRNNESAGLNMYRTTL